MNCLPRDTTGTDADSGNTEPLARPQVGRFLIVTMLLTAAALDLTRCGLVLRQPGTQHRLPGWSPPGWPPPR